MVIAKCADDGGAWTVTYRIGTEGPDDLFGYAGDDTLLGDGDWRTNCL